MPHICTLIPQLQSPAEQHDVFYYSIWYKISEGENFGEFGELSVISQIFLYKFSPWPCEVSTCEQPYTRD